MIPIIIDFLISAVVIYFLAALLPGITVKNFWTSIIAAVLIALANATIGKLLQLLSLPLNVITLGILNFVIRIAITALMVYLVSAIMKDFKVKSFGWALIFSLIIAVIGYFVSSLGILG